MCGVPSKVLYQVQLRKEVQKKYNIVSDISRYIRSARGYQEKTGIEPGIMLASIYISLIIMRELIDAPKKITLFSIDEEEEPIQKG